VSWPLGSSSKEDASLPILAVRSTACAAATGQLGGWRTARFDPAQSGVCKEANLNVLYQQSVRQERRGRPAGSWQAACTSSTTTQEQCKQKLEF